MSSLERVVFDADTIPPSIPTNLQAVVVSSSRIDLSWGASTDTGGSGLAGYDILRDALVIATGVQTSYSDTGLATGATYTYRVRARDHNGNRSDYTGQIQATTQGAGLAWQTTIPTQQIVVGQAYSLDVRALVTGEVLVSLLDSLPAGLSYSESTGLITGTPTTVQTVTANFRAFDSTVESNWAARAYLPGTVYRNNYTWQNAAETIPVTNHTECMDAAYERGQSQHLSKQEWQTAIKLSGAGALRFNRLPEYGTDEGTPDYRLSFDGLGAHTKVTTLREFYWSFCIYTHSVFGTHNFGGPGTPKLAIICEPDKSFDNTDVREFVLQRAPDGPFIISYQYITQRGAVGVRNTWAGQSFTTYHTFLKRNASFVDPPTTRTQCQQEHGYTRSDPFNDPDFAWDPVRLVLDGWTCIVGYTNMDTNTQMVWTAPYGEAPTLAFGTIGNAGFDVNADPFTGIQLLPRPENMTVPVPSPTFVVYSEIIVRRGVSQGGGPIPFPGGFSLPAPSVDYPWTGSSDNTA